MAAPQAPDPVHTDSVITPDGPDQKNPSAVKLTIVGCGGCGLNLGRLARQLVPEENEAVKFLYFDTSIVNAHKGELVYVIGNGSGSGSLRTENAREIEQKISTITSEEMGAGDVAIVIFSGAGGTGSVIGPVLVREYSRRLNMRVIAVMISETSSSVGAKNTINTLKSLTSIATNADLYLPMAILSNDQQAGRSGADKAAALIVNDLVELLTASVFEVDVNDRLNFINPAKVIGAKSGLKLIQTVSDQAPTDPTIVIGADSTEMVDSLLIIQNRDEASLPGVTLPTSRLRKAGFHYQQNRAIAGKVTGDIRAIDGVIDSVERIQQIDQSSRYASVDRLSNNNNGDGGLVF